jgi:hypothetical protein
MVDPLEVEKKNQIDSSINSNKRKAERESIQLQESNRKKSNICEKSTGATNVFIMGNDSMETAGVNLSEGVYE